MGTYTEFLSWETPQAERVESVFRGSIDMHIHFAPDPGVVRRFNAYETARAAGEAGMRAIVLKSDHCPTAQTAYTVSRLVPEVRVFGSLNIERCTTGGLGSCTAETVDLNARMGAKVLWFPTFDSLHTLRYMPGGDTSRGITVLDGDGALKSVVYDILDVVRRRDMVLCSGHLSFEETLALFRAAAKLGLTRLVVTHPMSDVIWPAFTLEQMRALTETGAFIEHCYRNCMPLLGGFRPERYLEVIRALGAERTILTTDFAQITDVSPAEGMRQFIATLMQMGAGDAELELMVKRNPAFLLGL